MTAVWFYVVPQLESSLRAQKRDDLRRVALATTDPLRRIAGSDVSSKHLDELVRAISDTSDARVTLFIVQRSRTRPSRVSGVLSDSAAAKEVDATKLLADRAANRNTTQTGYGSLNDETVAQTPVPIGSRKRAEWVALYSRSLDGVTETVDLIRRQLLAAGLIAALMA